MGFVSKQVKDASGGTFNLVLYDDGTGNLMAVHTLPSGAASDGTDAIGISPPSGGVGIRGWLSGIYNILGLFLFNGSGNLVVSGKTVRVAVTPTVTAAAYTTGNVVGGLMTFSNLLGGAQSGVLQTIRLKFGSIQTSQFDLYLFSSNPTASTFTDKTAPSINSADVGKVIGAYPLLSSTAFSGLGTHTIYSLDGIGTALSGAATYYGVLIARSTPTFASTADLKAVDLIVFQD